MKRREKHKCIYRMIHKNIFHESLYIFYIIKFKASSFTWLNMTWLIEWQYLTFCSETKIKFKIDNLWPLDVPQLNCGNCYLGYQSGLHKYSTQDSSHLLSTHRHSQLKPLVTIAHTNVGNTLRIRARLQAHQFKLRQKTWETRVRTHLYAGTNGPE